MTAKQLIMCASRPASFTRGQLEVFALHKVTIPFNGLDEIGLSTYDKDFLGFLRAHEELLHFAPIRVATTLSSGNRSKWNKIKSEWFKHGPLYPIIYVMDELFNRDLWGCPYDPYTERDKFIQWKKSQLILCQKEVDWFSEFWPSAYFFITSDRPVPPNAISVQHERLIRAYDIRRVEYAAELFGDDWRKHFGFVGWTIGGYLPKPIFGLGYSSTDIGNLVHALGLDFFLYYWAEDPEIWFNNKPTRNMLELHKAMIGG